MLYVCPECSKLISDETDACIHCGCPMSAVKAAADIAVEL